MRCVLRLCDACVRAGCPVRAVRGVSSAQLYNSHTKIRLCGRPISLLGTHGLVRVLSLQSIACLSIYVTCIHTRPHQKNGVPLSHLTPSKLTLSLARAIIA